MIKLVSFDFHIKKDHRLQNKKSGHLSVLLLNINYLKAYTHLRILEAEQYSCLNIATKWTERVFSSNAHVSCSKATLNR